MCVAIPARVTWIGERTDTSVRARAVVGSTETEIDVVLVPEVAVGDHVVVHSGYAISIVTPTEASITASLLRR